MRNVLHSLDHPAIPKWVEMEQVDNRIMDGAYPLGKACSGEVVVEEHWV